MNPEEENLEQMRLDICTEMQLDPSKWDIAVKRGMSGIQNFIKYRKMGVELIGIASTDVDEDRYYMYNKETKEKFEIEM